MDRDFWKLDFGFAMVCELGRLLGIGNELRFRVGFKVMDFFEGFFMEPFLAKLDLSSFLGCRSAKGVTSTMEGSSLSVSFLLGMSIWNPGLVPKGFWAGGYGEMSPKSFSGGSSLVFLISGVDVP